MNTFSTKTHQAVINSLELIKRTQVGEQVKELTREYGGTAVPLLDIIAKWQHWEDKELGFDYELSSFRTKSRNPELIRVDEASMQVS